MFNRFGMWWQLWMALIVIWSIVAITSGWMRLPQARDMTHDPQFMSKLSPEAASILLGTDVKAHLIHGSLIWSNTPRIVRMPNGTRLTFPAITTDAQAAFVAKEYSQLLDVEAHEQRRPYMMEMLAIWLAPCCCLLLAGFALRMVYPKYTIPLSRITPEDCAPSPPGSAVASVNTPDERAAETMGKPRTPAAPLRFPVGLRSS